MQRRLSDLLPMLTRFARTLARSDADSDDLVQMTCEEALSRANPFRPDTKLESSLLRIMQMVWFNEVRERSLRRQSEAEHAEFGPRPAHEGERVAEARIALSQVERVIFQLSDNERMLLLLVCVEGKTYKEAADTLGVPIGTVMSRLSRARLKLMTNLDAGARAPTDNVQQMTSWRR
jgi:RNA polymerase sigma-70 factor (ECF subfamily)